MKPTAGMNSVLVRLSNRPTGINSIVLPRALGSAE